MPTDVWNEFLGANRGYVLDLYDRYRNDPQSVDPEVRALFERSAPSWPADREVSAPAIGAAAQADKAIRADALMRAVRDRGFLFAPTNPLGDEGRAGETPPELSPGAFGLREEDLAAMPADLLPSPGRAAGGSALDAYRVLLDVYARGPLAYEFAHLDRAEERQWLSEQVESGAALGALDRPERRRLLDDLTRTEALEHYLHTTFPGVKRFSIEGVDALVPMLDRLVERAVEEGAGRVAIAMAHRGRLNVLAHVLGKPYADIVADFADHDEAAQTELAAAGRSGDVKYHLGWRSTRRGPGGREAEVWLCNNPSHLELVDPVVKGVARACQDDRTRPGEPSQDPKAGLCIAVHGDASFSGEGIVAETLNLSGLRGYDVGGAIHIIANNQIGFTTDPTDARATREASDLAKGYDMPIVHVNADRPEACLRAAALAWAFRQRFGRPILIDLVGYRRWGHNEGDEPAFTQPLMYERIRTRPTVRALYADVLAQSGDLPTDAAAQMLEAAVKAVAQSREAPRTPAAVAPQEWPDARPEAVSEARLRRIGASLLAWPSGFSPHERLARTLARRAQALDREGGIDWGYAETLAFASLLEDGVPVRLAGQDAERGTFAQRNLVLHDAQTGARHVPLRHLETARASFAVYNSPLSETAAMGFEYGYTVGAPEALVLWEAQYGDFANVAQPIVDQFLSAARAKWAEGSGLVLLLPHGYEGQGPEHSSARLERYLQLSAENNMTVANVTTAAQYFHLLRWQAATLGSLARPLVVMTPKSLLRHPLAMSSLKDLAEGRFEPVLDDPDAPDRPESVERVVLCSGKVSVELRTVRDKEGGGERSALVRLERLYPFPHAELGKVLGRYPKMREVVWMQEEPRNMGAWTFVEPYLKAVLPAGVSVTYAGPAAHAAPASGFAELHAAEMRRIVGQALGLADAESPHGTPSKER